MISIESLIEVKSLDKLLFNGALKPKPFKFYNLSVINKSL